MMLVMMMMTMVVVRVSDLLAEIVCVHKLHYLVDGLFEQALFGYSMVFSRH